MWLNLLGTISKDEDAQLEALVERGNRLTVRKAEASGILIECGHTFTRDDYRRKDER